MNNFEFGKQVEERTFQLAADILLLVESFPNTISAKVIANQLARSGTSVGANYREAIRARSLADFKNKVKISESEASESLYWLNLAVKCQFKKASEIQNVKCELHKILSILSKAGKTIRQKK